MAVRPIDAGVLQDNLTDIYGDGNRLVYLKDVLSLIDEQPTLTPPNEWVSVYDRLPEPGERVLATDCGFVGEFYINKRGKWQRYNVNCSELLMALDILYWTPLPAPPDKDNNVHAKTPNEPLTLGQLREMDGQPVWVERNESPHDGKWFIVDHADIENPDKTLYTKEGVTYSDYGVHFTAYAYPPAHIDREAWVSVEERLPEDEKDGETVLVIVFGKPHENITLHGAIMTAGYFRDEGWVLNEYPEWEGPEVTHWMPLPSPPAELEKRMGVQKDV